MNRDIKFRVWDKDIKQMEEVGALDWSDGEVITCNTYNHKHYMTEPGQFVIMQYTGLKDKNGKEIYEGDVVKINDHFITSIVWGYGQFTFHELQADNRLSVWSKIEVIGNIYENPELIRKEKE